MSSLSRITSIPALAELFPCIRISRERKEISGFPAEGEDLVTFEDSVFVLADVASTAFDVGVADLSVIGESIFEERVVVAVTCEIAEDAGGLPKIGLAVGPELFRSANGGTGFEEFVAVTWISAEDAAFPRIGLPVGFDPL